MVSKLIKKALEEIIPTFEGEFPSTLIDYVDRLYNLSAKKLNLKQQEEVARYHLCAIVGVEKLQLKYKLPSPVLDKVPMLPTTSNKLLLDMREMLSNGSPTKSNPATPSKIKRSNKSTPKSAKTPGSIALTPSSSVRKRLFDDPKTPGSSESPSKRSRGRPPGALNRTTLEKLGQSPFQTASTIKAVTPFLSPNKKVHLSTTEVIAFCNNFQLPQDTTINVLHTFSEYHNRIKHEWALLCGLIALVYMIVNHDALNSKPASKKVFYDKLHSLQNGGLLKQSLAEWINLINEFFKDTKWVKQLKFQYGYYSSTNIEIPSMGNMLSVSKLLQPEAEYAKWKEWSCSRAKTTKSRSNKHFT